MNTFGVWKIVCVLVLVLMVTIRFAFVWIKTKIYRKIKSIFRYEPLEFYIHFLYYGLRYWRAHSRIHIDTHITSRIVEKLEFLIHREMIKVNDWFLSMVLIYESFVAFTIQYLTSLNLFESFKIHYIFAPCCNLSGSFIGYNDEITCLTYSLTWNRHETLSLVPSIINFKHQQSKIDLIKYASFPSSTFGWRWWWYWW